MKKFINQVDDMLSESLQGFAAAHADIVQLHLAPNFVTRRHKASNKVALISGGGSGHEPLHTGFVGKGMLDAACPGFVFTSPSPDQMLAAAEAVECGKGVLFIVKNYAGDVMNFEMAAEMLSCPNASVLTNDDVAVINSSYTTGRRGVAGTVIVEKTVGSLAESGADLATCAAFAEQVNQACASMGVALTSCTVPAAGKATFAIADNELEMGVGIHGEPGRKREAMRPAQQIVDDMLTAILQDMEARNIDTQQGVILLLNGFAATPLMELYLLYHNALQHLQARGIKVQRSLVGNYTTALDMAGASITLCALNQQILQHWDSPVHSAGLRWGI